MNLDILILIIGMGLVTFLPRFFPMAFLARREIPERMRMGLAYFPIAILSAIVFPILFSNEGGGIGIHPRLLFSAFPVLALAWFSKSLWGSVAMGMLAYWGLGFVF